MQGNEDDVQDFVNGTLIEGEITGSNSTTQVLSATINGQHQPAFCQARKT